MQGKHAIRFAIAAAGALLVPAVAGAASPYSLVATTALPAMPAGDFDQLVADVAHNRLYVSAEDGATMDVFDLATGALLRSGGAVKAPHKVALDARRQHLFVADGDDGAVKVLDTDLALVARIAVGPKADTGLFDPILRLFYVGSRDPEHVDSDSIVSAISADSFKVVATYHLAATTVKGMVLDRQGDRIFVSLRDKNAIGVIHRDTGLTEIWSTPGLHRPVPLVFDAAHRALYAGSRGPGALDILDASDGGLRTVLSSTETSDTMTFDRARHTLYLSGDSGMSRYRIARDGTVRLMETDPQLVGKTSLYVAERHRLYVMRPKTPSSPAALTIFSVR